VCVSPGLTVHARDALHNVQARTKVRPRGKAPPLGTDWVHEIQHDGYRMIVRRDGPTVRVYSRNRRWLDGAASHGEVAVLGPDGLSRFEELSRCEAARSAILYSFDLVEHDGAAIFHS
jgi:bifunctional non-homologous end joining protein LigD